MDSVDRLEALIAEGGPDAAAQARALLEGVKSASRLGFDAVEEFLIELMTLAFAVEAGLEGFQDSARRLARMRLYRLKLLLA
ncbi:MAG: hypothetical protein J0I79_07085 [Mesorhizobium sp.]|uniref:hypothetical protein n=1 Tax=Mesorhizobium sp. TaxID=1871066 RepID=UPI001AD18C02|nr:hypothetical protein [Mesorhizobium sp.]MBN9217700.1 hypothetical protein [Mesorhizobium sp.]